MNSLRSSVWLRTLLCDTTAEFQALNSTELPDGATVFNRQDETLWRLDKTAGTTFDSLGSNVLQKPNDGTPARWFAVEVDGGSPVQFSGYAEASVAVTMTGSQWNALGTTAGTFTPTSGAGSDLFTLNPTTSEITYNGPPAHGARHHELLHQQRHWRDADCDARRHLGERRHRHRQLGRSAREG
jgi:hypothetical protein